jgi:hypothetical protein
MTIEGFLDCEDKLITGNNNTNFILSDFAWLRSAHTGGITMSVRQFTSAQFHDGASFEIGGNQNKTLSFVNPQMRNLKINASGSVSTLNKDSIHITGVLMLDSGSFVLDSVSLHLSGAAISGNGNNLLADSNSSFYFSGNDTGVFIPSSVSDLKILGINKAGNDVFLKNNLRIHHQLQLSNGKINTGEFTLYCVESSENGIVSGNDSSFVRGKLSRKIPPGDSLKIHFPIGGEYKHPLEISGVDCDDETWLSVQAFEQIPGGNSIQANLSNRYWRMQVYGLNRIRAIHTLKLQSHSLFPALQDSSDIVISENDSLLSYLGLGGEINTQVNTISSTIAIKGCRFSNAGNENGIYIGIADSYPGIEADSLCEIQLELNVLLQGLYNGNGTMRTALSDTSVKGVCDTVIVSLHGPVYPNELISSHIALADTTGKIILNTRLSDGMEYYLSVKHRNSLETWSKYPIMLNSPLTTYNFTDSLSKAFGNNLFDLQDGFFAIYCGDVFNSTTQDDLTGDGYINLEDLRKLEIAMQNFLSGYYKCDLTGDGIIDNADYSLIENNVNLNVESKRP